jgi:hypothetical protein
MKRLALIPFVALALSATTAHTNTICTQGTTRTVIYVPQREQRHHREVWVKVRVILCVAPPEALSDTLVALASYPTTVTNYGERVDEALPLPTRKRLELGCADRPE